MARSNPSPVERVAGKLFDRRRKTSSGSQAMAQPQRAAPWRQSKAKRLSGAIQRRSPAVTKIIRNAGCTSKAGLKGQLSYVFSKADAMFDTFGKFEGQESLTNAQMNAIARDWEEDFWGTAKQGYTTHMLLSFPVGTDVQTVRDVSEAVCEELFNTGDVRYRYVAGVHTDRDNPHTHIILNRRGTDNRLLTFRQGTDMSYESIRECMVAHAERVGIHLEASSRYERGIVERAPTVRETRAAIEEGREAVGVARVGASLDYATQQISENAMLYSALAVLASNEDLSRIEWACERAAAFLGKGEELGESLDLRGRDRSDAEIFDDRLEQMSEVMAQVRSGLRDMPPVERPAVQSAYCDILTRLTELTPDAPGARSLREAPPEISLYAREHITNPEQLGSAGLRREVAVSLEGTGVDAGELLARLEMGAKSLYLERIWGWDDLRSIADKRDLDLNVQADHREALKSLDQVYNEVFLDLRDAGVVEIEDQVEEVEPEPVAEIAPVQDTPPFERPATRQVPASVSHALLEYLSGKLPTDLEGLERMARDLRDYLSTSDLDAVRRGDAAPLTEITSDPNAAAFLQAEILLSDRRNGVVFEQGVLQDALHKGVAQRPRAQRGHEEDGHGE